MVKNWHFILPHSRRNLIKRGYHVMVTVCFDWSRLADISLRAARIEASNSSPSATTACNLSPDSWFSFSNCCKLWSWRSGVDFSLGSESIMKSISFTVLVISVLNNAACPSCVTSGGGAATVGGLLWKPGIELVGAVCWMMPTLLQKCSASWLRASWSWVNLSAIPIKLVFYMFKTCWSS